MFTLSHYNKAHYQPTNQPTNQYIAIDFFVFRDSIVCVKLQVLIRGEASDTKDFAAVCCTTWFLGPNRSVIGWKIR